LEPLAKDQIAEYENGGNGAGQELGAF
jgi:hypothetical protein